MKPEDQQKLEHFITCLTAVKEGKTVEYDYAVKGWDSANHIIDGERLSSFEEARWRVKPDAPKVVPWTFATAPGFAVKAKRKESGNHGLLVFLPNGCLFMMGSNVHDLALTIQYDYDRVAKELEQFDGSPCGIEQKEESEWPKWAVDSIGDLWRKASKDANWQWLDKLDDGTFREADCFCSWETIKSKYDAVEIPAAEAERIMSEAKEGVRK